MVRPTRRARALREFKWSMAQVGLFVLFAGGMSVAIVFLAAMAEKLLPLPEPWKATPYMAAIPLQMAALWASLSWSGAITARGRGREPPRFAVTFDDKRITSSGEGRDDETVAWSDLTEVVILNEDAFPVGSQYWLLAGADGKGAAVSSEAEGMKELLAAMQDRLPGFDNEAVIGAMASLDGAFRVWKKPG